MKSQDKEDTIKTNCKNCTFAIYNNSTQISCAFDRISKFDNSVTPAYDNDKEFYVIDRFCTYYRDNSWGYSLEDKEKVKNEAATSFDIIFNCNEINNDQAKIIQHFINNNRYYNNKLNFVLLHEYEKYMSVKDYIVYIAKDLNKKVNITACEKIDNYLHQLALKSKNNFHAIIKYPELLELNTLYLINDYINEELKRIVVADINNAMFISNFIYKTFYTMNNNGIYNKNVTDIVQNCKENNMYVEI